jgi:5-methyltetrahydropteroyltriglutamate--homocysteine methyltransferase
MSINVPQFSEVATGTIGFPRVGKDRELKKALESYWAGTTDRTHLLDVAAQVEKANLLAQVDAGIERIGVGSFSLYDQVLDWAFRLGLIPSRFANSGKVRTHAPFLCGVSIRMVCACNVECVCCVEFA